MASASAWACPEAFALSQQPSDEHTLPCRAGDRDPDLWFAESPSALEQAKQLCGSCPARAACLAGAIERQEPWGVWGGEILEHGTVVASKRGRGRPRKNALRGQQESAA